MENNQMSELDALLSALQAQQGCHVEPLNEADQAAVDEILDGGSMREECSDGEEIAAYFESIACCLRNVIKYRYGIEE